MENWCTIFVHYNGQFDDPSIYVGGEERLVYIPMTNLSIQYLRNSIQSLLDSENIQLQYNLYYTGQSRNGRNVRSLLATDADLQRLCSVFSEPNIYVIFNNAINIGVGSSQREPSPYRTFISSFSPPPNATFSPCPEDLQRFHSSMFFDQPFEGGASGSSHIPDLNEGGGSEESDDDANEEEAKDSSESEEEVEDSGESEDENFNQSLMHCTVAEFSTWVQSVGSMNAFVSNLLPAHPLPEGMEVQLNNWLLPSIPLDTSDSPVLQDVAAILDQELTEGAIFWSRDDLLVVVGLWHMEQRQEFKFARSDSTRIEYKCKRDNSCSFLIRATCKANCWIVRKFKPVHSCRMNLAGVGACNVRSKTVATYFSRKMRRQGSLVKPREIMGELQTSFGIHTTYGSALKARNRALSMLYGSVEDSFKMLPKYLEVLVQYNAGTLTDLDIAPDGHFRHLFVALGVCRSAFESSLRQFIVVDATHLKGRNKGVLFVVVTKDGNEQVFSLAIGVGPIENDESWLWFITRLRMAFGCKDQLLIVSDQHISISNAMSRVYPGTAHGLCFYHLLNKLTSFRPNIIPLYDRAAYAYRATNFKQAMDQMKISNPAAYDKLMDVGPEKWAKSKCHVRRYSFLTSNAAEVFNARLLDARRLPICSLLEAYRSIVEAWFDQRCAKAANSSDDLTEEAVAKMAPVAEKARGYNVVPNLQHTFKVTDGTRSWNVDLQSSFCECREFQLGLMSCVHAAAAIRANVLNFYDYVYPYYKTETWREIYGGVINPLPPQDEWDVSSEAAFVLVLPPIITRQAGRPRNSRRPSGAEHSQSSSSRHRAPKRCSICRSNGHTKRYCPDRVQDNH